MKSVEFTSAGSSNSYTDTTWELEPAEPSWVDVNIATNMATSILRDVMQFRRTFGSNMECDASTCRVCLAPHMEQVISAIIHRKPITFALPAFPGKSPNPAKVLGPLPDLAEQHALLFLNSLCDRIQRLYAPGAQIILCSDGRVFSDVIGMNEDDVTAYQREMDRMIEELGHTSLSTFSLDDLLEGEDFAQVRRKLMEQYTKPLESMKEKVRADEQSHRMYCGITRFLVEDSMYPGQTKTRSQIQKDCRARAYEVIRRSNAWSELIAERFPHAVRLSIHPQTCGSTKLGIQLVGTDSWMTPWHGVAVDTGGKFVLMKRWEAEKLEARLVQDSRGRASHYELAR